MFYALQFWDGESIGAFLMENKIENSKEINWEKIGVYIGVTASLLTVIIYLFQIKDAESDMKERIAKLEVKIEYVEKEIKR